MHRGILLYSKPIDLQKCRLFPTAAATIEYKKFQPLKYVLRIKDNCIRKLKKP